MIRRHSEPWPWNKLHKPTPAELGLTVTVCIAARCELGNTIIAATDHMLTVGDISADNSAFKDYIVANNWEVMVSGDVSHVPFIVRRTRNKLKNITSPSAEEVASAVSETITEQLHEEIEKRVLSPYGYKLPTFRKEGSRQLTSSEFDRISRDCDAVTLQLSTLVSGFDDDGAHIMVVEERHKPESYDLPGFWAIGSGASPAVTSMLFHSHHDGFDYKESLSECVYYVLEAKFMAETVRTVGQKTMLVMRRKDQPALFLNGDAVEKIRKIWRRYGAPRLPSAAFKYTQDFLRGYVADMRLCPSGPFDLDDDVEGHDL